MGQVENCAACQYRTRPVFLLYTYGDNGTKEAGQVTLDDAAVPSGVDATVQSIATDYDDMGRVWTVTSYPGTGGTGTAVNQVEDSYNGWGILADEWQNPDGQVNPSSSPAVQYTYADGASGDVAAYLRAGAGDLSERPGDRLQLWCRQHLAAGSGGRNHVPALFHQRRQQRGDRCGLHLPGPRHDRHRGLQRPEQSGRHARRCARLLADELLRLRPLRPRANAVVGGRRQPRHGRGRNGLLASRPRGRRYRRG